MAQAFKSQSDLRAFTHTLLSRIIGSTGSTTLMITESPPGLQHIGLGVEEFIADGVIHFNLVPVAGDARIRYVEIMKMRGTNHQMGPIPIEITGEGLVVRHPHIRGGG
jgi:KaiC/GvpD/RAD55 family RecA-like ATPase